MAYDTKVLADSVLSSVWGNRGFPVDPVVVAKELGLVVNEGKLADNISGALMKAPGADPVILLNASDHVTRKRFSCAHELGHFVDREFNRDGANVHEYEYVDLRSDASSEGTDPEEVFANKFAADLLMPCDAVSALVESAREQGKTDFAIALDVSSTFGVSLTSARIRLNTLGFA